MLAAVSAWRLPELPLECAIEGSFRFVSDLGGDFCDAPRSPLERSSGHLKPPAGQVRHRWLGEIACEALHQGGPRNAYLIDEALNCPRMGNAAVQQG